MLTTQNKPKRQVKRNITGIRSGMLVAESVIGSDGRRTLWTIRCDCGRTRVMGVSEFLKLNTQSCGCNTNKLISKSRTKHGLQKHPLYGVWAAMIARCYRVSHISYKNYGGRGITVTLPWRKFEAFWADMSSTYVPGLTLERSNNDLGYGPDNCVWATDREQARNRSTNRLIPTPQGDMPLWRAAEVSGLNANTLHARFTRGWPADQMFRAPDRGRKL